MTEIKKPIPPRYIIMWRDELNGENGWEAVSDGQAAPFLKELVEKRAINPASIFVTTQASWMFPEHHRGKRTVWMNEFFDEINGTGFADPYKGPDVKPAPQEKEKDLYGFISPGQQPHA